MKRLRIALLKSSFRMSGGLEKYCLQISRSLREKGHAVDVLSTVSMPDQGVFSICRAIKPSALQILWFDYHCRKYLEKHRYDVVFGFDRHFLPLTHYRAGNGCHRAYLFRRACMASFLKKVLLYCNPLHIVTLLSEKQTFEKSPPRYIICNSHLVRREILQYYPKVPQDKVVVIHNGVEWEEFAPCFETREKQSDSLRILFIGHEWGRKGLAKLLQALSFVQDIPLYLTAVGKERHHEQFSKLVSCLGLQDRVRLIPQATNVMPLLQSCNIAVIPSLYDPFANVTVEALAMGLFVVTTTANGGGEVIEQGVNGFVLDEPCSAEELACAIRKSFDIVRNGEVAVQIRHSVKDLDFSTSLKRYTQLISR